MEPKRILIVANQTAPGAHLREVVRERMAEGPCRFLLVVPATPPKSKWTWNEGEVFGDAQKRMEEAVAGLKEVGAEVEGRVEEGSPMIAVEAVVEVERYELKTPFTPFDEIIVSTLPQGVSRWLKQDLVHRLERRYQVPVTHVIGERPAPVR